MQHESYRHHTASRRTQTRTRARARTRTRTQTISSFYTQTQFGIRLTIGRVEAFANLTEKCATNNKVVENSVKGVKMSY